MTLIVYEAYGYHHIPAVDCKINGKIIFEIRRGREHKYYEPVGKETKGH